MHPNLTMLSGPLHGLIILYILLFVHYFFVVGSDCPGLCAVPELKFGQPSGRNDVEVS